MNLQTLLEIPNLKEWNLEFYYYNSNPILILKVSDDDFKNIDISLGYDLLIENSTCNNLNVFLEIFFQRRRRRVGFELPKETKHELHELSSNLNEKFELSLFLFSSKELKPVIISLDKQSLNSLKNWLTDSKVEQPNQIKEIFKSTPLNILIPQKSNTLFWFKTKLSKDLYTITRENQQLLELNADNFEGELALYLNYDKTLISSFILPEENINPAIRSDFRLLLSQEHVSILISDENQNSNNILNVSISIHENVKDRIRFYLEL